MNPYSKCRPFSGYFEGQFLRSFSEFMVALQLKFIEKKKFKTEGLRLNSRNGMGYKVPDFVVYDNNEIVSEIIEVKNNNTATESTIVEYSVRKSAIKNVNYRFITMNSTHIRKLFLELSNIIGQTALKQLINDYKAQRNEKSVGFVGINNPMFGKKHSTQTKALMSKKAAHFGADNGMTGKTHTLEAKQAIAEKWKDETRKNEMIKKGFLTHWNNMSDEQKKIAFQYFSNKSAGNDWKKPDFINRCYSINKDKIIKLFGSREVFLENFNAA